MTLGCVPRSSRSLASARRSRQARHVALRIVQVAEDQRARPARLRARRLDLAVAHLAVLRLGLNLRTLDALHAERALLHHADFTQRDVRIELQLQRLVPRRVEEIEEPHVVRARVGAVPRADAAVVDLRVEPVFGVVARVGGTHRLARRVVALLAHHGTEFQPDVGKVAFPVALDPQPVLGAADRRLVGADRRNVVLRMAGDDAGAAAGAAIEVGRHSPRGIRAPSSPVQPIPVHHRVLVSHDARACRRRTG